MRILMLGGTFPPYRFSGGELYIHELSRSLQDRGHEVTVCYPVEREPDESLDCAPVPGVYEQVAVRELHIPEYAHEVLSSPRINVLVRQVVTELRPDVVHVHGLDKLGFGILPIFREYGLPVYYTAHDFSFICPNGLLQHFSGNICHNPVPGECTSCRAIQSVLTGNRPQKNLMDINVRRCKMSRAAFIGLDFVQYPSAFTREMHRMAGLSAGREEVREIGMQLFQRLEHRPSSVTRFSFLSGICHGKGLDVAVKALNHLPNAGECELNVYGSVNNELYFERVMGMAKPEARVNYKGAYTREDLPRILAETDAMVLPSRMETFSFVAREALHAGAPLLATRVGALAEVVEHGKNGFLFAKDDALELASYMELISTDKRVARTLSEAGTEIKSIGQDALELEEIYQTLARDRASERGRRNPDRADAGTIVESDGQLKQPGQDREAA